MMWGRTLDPWTLAPCCRLVPRSSFRDGDSQAEVWGACPQDALPWGNDGSRIRRREKCCCLQDKGLSLSRGSPRAGWLFRIESYSANAVRLYPCVSKSSDKEGSVTLFSWNQSAGGVSASVQPHPPSIQPLENGTTNCLINHAKAWGFPWLLSFIFTSHPLH